MLNDFLASTLPLKTEKRSRDGVVDLSIRPRKDSSTLDLLALGMDSPMDEADTGFSGGGIPTLPEDKPRTSRRGVMPWVARNYNNALVSNGPVMFVNNVPADDKPQKTKPQVQREFLQNIYQVIGIWNRRIAALENHIETVMPGKIKVAQARVTELSKDADFVAFPARMKKLQDIDEQIAALMEEASGLREKQVTDGLGSGKSKNQIRREEIQKEVLELQVKRRKLWPDVIKSQQAMINVEKAKQDVKDLESQIPYFKKDLEVYKKAVEELGTAEKGKLKLKGNPFKMDKVDQEVLDVINNFAKNSKRYDPSELLEALAGKGILSDSHNLYVRYLRGSTISDRDIALNGVHDHKRAGELRIRSLEADLKTLQRRQANDETDLAIPKGIKKDGSIPMTEAELEALEEMASVYVNLIALYKFNPIHGSILMADLWDMNSRMMNGNPSTNMLKLFGEAVKDYAKSGKVVEDAAEGFIMGLVFRGAAAVVGGPVVAVVGAIMMAVMAGGLRNKLESIINMTRNVDDTILDGDSDEVKKKKNDLFTQRQAKAMKEFMQHDVIPILPQLLGGLGAGKIGAKGKSPVLADASRRANFAGEKAKIARGRATALEAEAARAKRLADTSKSPQDIARANRLAEIAERLKKAATEAETKAADAKSKLPELAEAVKEAEKATKEYMRAKKSGNRPALEAAEAKLKAAMEKVQRLQDTVGRNNKVRAIDEAQLSEGNIDIRAKNQKPMSLSEAPPDSPMRTAMEKAGLSEEQAKLIDLEFISSNESPSCQMKSDRIKIKLPKNPDGTVRITDLAHELAEAKMRLEAKTNPKLATQLAEAERLAKRYQDAQKAYREALEEVGNPEAVPENIRQQLAEARFAYENSPTELRARAVEMEALSKHAEKSFDATGGVDENLLNLTAEAGEQAANLKTRQRAMERFRDARSVEALEAAEAELTNAGYTDTELGLLRTLKGLRSGLMFPANATGPQIASALGGEYVKTEWGVHQIKMPDGSYRLYPASEVTASNPKRAPKLKTVDAKTASNSEALAKAAKDCLREALPTEAEIISYLESQGWEVRVHSAGKHGKNYIATRDGKTKYFSVDKGNQGSGGDAGIPHQGTKGGVVKLFPDDSYNFDKRKYGTVDLDPLK